MKIPAGETGRAWLPASTGLPSDRPPTRDEAREAWMRQARGVYDMTRRARGADVGHARADTLVGALLLLAGAGFVTGLVMLPPDQHVGLVIALQVIAGLALVAVQLGGTLAIASDAMAEVTARTAESWASSPLSTSAWIAGKTAFHLEVQALATLRVLPLVAASAALGGIRLREAVIVGALGLAGTFISGVSVSAAVLEPRPPIGRLGRRAPGAAGSGVPALRTAPNPAAALAVTHVVLGIIGAAVSMPFIFGGATLQAVPPLVSLLYALTCLASPLSAGVSAFFPTLGIEVAGVHLPMWCVSLVVAAVSAPAIVATSRLRWRAPDGELGLSVRPALLAWWSTVAALTFAILARTPVSASVAACLVPLLATASAGLMAGVTRLPDLAAGAPLRWQRVVGLNRATAHLFALAVLAVTTLLSMAIAPPSLFAHVAAAPGILVLAACIAPCAFIAAGTGRESRRAMAAIAAGLKAPAYRPATLVFAVMLAATFSPVGVTILTGLGYLKSAEVVKALALLSPIHVLFGVGQMLGLNFGGTVPAINGWLVGIGAAVQAVLAAAAHVLQRRAPEHDA